MNHDSIGFFYPTRAVGGAQYLFVRIAEYLIEYTPYKVVLIDYADGFIRSKLGDKNYRFIKYIDGKPVVIQEPLLLVLSLSFVSSIQQCLVLPDTTRLFFWDLHPYNLIEQLALSGVYKLLMPMNAHHISSLVERTRWRKLAYFVNYAAATHGIAFMAESNKVYNQQLFACSAPTSYLPLPIDTIVQSLTQTSAQNSREDFPIHIAWLSRLDTWKTTVLFRLLDDVQAYERKNGLGTIHVHIIGDGSMRTQVEQKSASVRISMAGRLEGSALTEYMLAYIHVGFAMGTSALEFAVRGIPTVLTPIYMNSDNRRWDKIYRWLHDSQGYDVASEETRRPTSLRTFSDIIQQLQGSAGEHLGDLARTYAIDNHDLRNVGAMFASDLAQCTLRYGDLRRLGIFEYTPYERLLFGAKKLFKRRPRVLSAVQRSTR